MLLVYLIASDRAGHTWGPYSEGMAELIGAMDRQIARLLRALDDTVGEGRYWLVLTSDHGMSPSGAQARDAGLHPRRMDSSRAEDTMRRAMAERWGEDDWFMPYGVGGADSTFNRATLRKHGVSMAEAQTVVGDADPLEDIRNTRSIWRVLQGGRVVDREVLIGTAPGAAALMALDGIKAVSTVRPSGIAAPTPTP